MTVFHGEYRVRGENDAPNTVHVTDKINDSSEFVTEDDYNEAGLQPPFDELPWRGEPRK